MPVRNSGSPPRWAVCPDLVRVVAAFAVYFRIIYFISSEGTNRTGGEGEGRWVCVCDPGYCVPYDERLPCLPVEPAPPHKYTVAPSTGLSATRSRRPSWRAASSTCAQLYRSVLPSCVCAGALCVCIRMHARLSRQQTVDACPIRVLERVRGRASPVAGRASPLSRPV